MKLNEPAPQQLAQLYRQELTSAFPPEELKPLRSMLSLMEQGRYQALGLYDGEDLVAYALIWLEPGCPFALLDYLGISPSIAGTSRRHSISASYRSPSGPGSGPIPPDAGWKRKRTVFPNEHSGH